MDCMEELELLINEHSKALTDFFAEALDDLFDDENEEEDWGFCL